MTDLSDDAKLIMSTLKKMGYSNGDFFPAGRLFYLFDDKDRKQRAIEQLVSAGLVTVAPNLSIGITPAGVQWNAASNG